MQARSRTLYSYALALLAWAVIVTGMVRTGRYALGSPVAAVSVLAFIAMTTIMRVWRVPAGRFHVSVGTLISFLSIALMGAWPALGVKVVGTVIATPFVVPRRQWLLGITVMGALLGVTTLIAGRVYVALAGTPPVPFVFRPGLVLPFLAMAVTYGLVNILLAAVYSWLRTGTSIGRTCRELIGRFWLNESMFALIGLIALAVYAQMHSLGLIAVFGLLVGVRFTFQMYADAHHFRSEMAQTLANTLKFKDEYTAAHSKRVADYAVRIGREMGLTDLQLERLYDSALLHDIGKVAIPDAVLVKPGPLDPAEKRHMDRHAGAGSDILEHSPHLRELAHYVREHHTDFNARQQPVEARIISVADAFDAMTTDRPYRRALPLEAALGELHRGSGSQFDPAVIAAFLRVLGPASPALPAGGGPVSGPSRLPPPRPPAGAAPGGDAGPGDPSGCAAASHQPRRVRGRLVP